MSWKFNPFLGGLDYYSADGEHFHDADTLQCDGINSNGGNFAFSTTGDVTFNHGVILSPVDANLTIGGGAGNNQVMLIFKDATNVSGILVLKHTTDEMIWATSAYSGNQFILSTFNTYSADHDHASQAHPTLFIHSSTNPNDDNTQYLQLYHDATKGYILSGKGIIDFGDENLQTSGILTVGAFSTPYRNILTVAESGGDHTTVIGAIAEAISGTIIYIMPGTYAEDFSASPIPDGVSVVGADRKRVIISPTTANTVLLLSGNNVVSNLTLKSAAGIANPLIGNTGNADNVYIKSIDIDDSEKVTSDTVHLVGTFGNWIFEDVYWNQWHYDAGNINITGDGLILFKNCIAVANPDVNAICGFLNITSGTNIHIENSYFNISRSANENAINFINSTNPDPVYSQNNQIFIDAGTKQAYGFICYSVGAPTSAVFYSYNDIINLTSSDATYHVYATSGRTVTVYVLGGNIITKGGAGTTTITSLQQSNIKTGGFTATANLDIGAYSLQALNFISDVATGTSPYACTSTTLNTNLNADLLDSKHVGTSGSAIPLLDGTNTWSGVQTFSAGTSFGADLTFENSALLTNSVNKTITLKGESTTGGSWTSLDVQFDASAWGVTLRGNTSQSGTTHIIYFSGSLIATDDQFISFGASQDARISWETTGNDFLLIDTGVNNAAYTGNIVIASKSSAPTPAYPLVSNPTLRIQANTTDIDEYIQFFHDGTRAHIHSGFGGLAINCNIDATGEIDSTVGFSVNEASGWTGTFINGDGDEVTVSGGIITGVAAP